MKSDLPPGLPPLPPNTRYGGRLKDQSGTVYGWVHGVDGIDFWIGACQWSYAPDPAKDVSADWHVALPIEAVREPANYSGQCDACRTIYEGTKVECKARKCRECAAIDEPAKDQPQTLKEAVDAWHAAKDQPASGATGVEARVCDLERKLAEAKEQLAEARTALEKSAKHLDRAYSHTVARKERDPIEDNGWILLCEVREALARIDANNHETP